MKHLHSDCSGSWFPPTNTKQLLQFTKTWADVIMEKSYRLGRRTSPPPPHAHRRIRRMSLNKRHTAPETRQVVCKVPGGGGTGEPVPACNTQCMGNEESHIVNERCEDSSQDGSELKICGVGLDRSSLSMSISSLCPWYGKTFHSDFMVSGFLKSALNRTIPLQQNYIFSTILFKHSLLAESGWLCVYCSAENGFGASEVSEAHE